jgi:hypothetical protein
MTWIQKSDVTRAAERVAALDYTRRHPCLHVLRGQRLIWTGFGPLAEWMSHARDGWMRRIVPSEESPLPSGLLHLSLIELLGLADNPDRAYAIYSDLLRLVDPPQNIRRGLRRGVPPIHILNRILGGVTIPIYEGVNVVWGPTGAGKTLLYLYLMGIDPEAYLGLIEQHDPIVNMVEAFEPTTTSALTIPGTLGDLDDAFSAVDFSNNVYTKEGALRAGIVGLDSLEGFETELAAGEPATQLGERPSFWKGLQGWDITYKRLALERGAHALIATKSARDIATDQKVGEQLARLAEGRVTGLFVIVGRSPDSITVDYYCRYLRPRKALRFTIPLTPAGREVEERDAVIGDQGPAPTVRRLPPLETITVIPNARKV